jgi:transposase InsO family protein
MGWENHKVEHQRLQLVMAYIRNEASMTDLCKRYGVSRKTAYKWYNIFCQRGKEGLKDMARAPQEPYRLYTKDQIEIAIDLKLKYRKYGPKKILVKLNELYPKLSWPSPTRLYEIYKDHGLVTDRRIRSRVPATSPLGHLSDCNDTWAVDLKGWFLTGDGIKCEPLTITDSYSRYLIKCKHLDRHSVEYVWPIFEEAFHEYGLPFRVRSDNGPPFGCVGAGRLTRLSINFIKAGVIPEWIRPGHPEENGRHERFHLTLKEAVASPPQATLILQIKEMERFWTEYNFERPHEALGMKTPGNFYSKSSRSWDGKLRSPEYDTSMIVRKVCQSGCIWLKQKEHYIGQALQGEHVGLKHNDTGDLEVYYGPVYLGKLDQNKGLEKPKMKTRKR